MTPQLFLSRARLRRDAPIAALRDILLPANEHRRAAATHRLVWTLFADSSDRERDFLWREGDGGTFYLLSARAPEDRHGIFDLDPPKPFAPILCPGDRLAFSLRVNPTIARKLERGASERGRRCDVVMDALFRLPSGTRAAERQAAARAAGRAWLVAQGTKSGFEIDGPDEDERSFRAVAYRVLEVDRSGRAMRIGVLDVEGRLTVREPEAFLEALRKGFGRAKAFGCGLMLIRRC